MILFGLRLWGKRRVIRLVQGAPGIARRYSRPVKKKSDQHYLWGNEFLDDDDASLSFLTVGSPGSGKTINILLLLKTVVDRMLNPTSGVRALVYDSKKDLLSTIRGMGMAEDDILVLNPFDRRRYRWDLAKDITSLAEARDLASLFVPPEKGATNPYFTDVAQQLLAGMITAFQQNAPGTWTLRDLILGGRSSADLMRILSSCPYTEGLLSHFSVTDTSENVCSTLSNRLNDFEPVAASWNKTNRKFTLKEWLDGQKMLVLGNSATCKQPIRKINQLLFSSIAKAVLDRPGKAKAKHWFFLDELRELGALDMLADMMIVGRSKGASMVLGFQDIHGVYAEYGKERAQEIVGCTNHYALLRINPTQPETQKWASDVAGQLRFDERKRGESRGKDGIRIDTREERKTEHMYIPSFFHRQLRDIKRDGVMEGLYYTKGELYVQPYPVDHLFENDSTRNWNRVPDPAGEFSDFEPLDVSSLLLEPWDEEDRKRLHISDLEIRDGHWTQEEADDQLGS